MTRPARLLIAVAAVCGALGVVMGAFAAHGAGPQIKPLLQTGGHYLMIHALLAVVCGLIPGSRLAGIAGWLAVAGGGVFAAALYAAGPLHLSAFGMIAPIGGLLMVLAWLVLAVAVLRLQSAGRSPVP